MKGGFYHGLITDARRIFRPCQSPSSSRTNCWPQGRKTADPSPDGAESDLVCFGQRLPLGGRAAGDGLFGATAHRRLQVWERLGVWDHLHADLLRLLRQTGRLDPDVAVVDSVYTRAFGGGDKTGPSPVDRRKKGTKYTLLVDRHGVPLGIRTTGANVSDHQQLLPLVVDFPKVGGKPGRPKEFPDELYADRGFDSDPARWVLAWLGINPHIARRRAPHGSGLGKVRWVVERTISWLKGLRRMRVRYDRLMEIQEAWTTLAASVICFRLLHDELPLAA